jgi:hypothetical protein
MERRAVLEKKGQERRRVRAVENFQRQCIGLTHGGRDAAKGEL